MPHCEETHSIKRFSTTLADRKEEDYETEAAVQDCSKGVPVGSYQYQVLDVTQHSEAGTGGNTLPSAGHLLGNRSSMRRYGTHVMP
jgi:hypothetical protein